MAPAADFRNLDFEETNTAGLPFGTGAPVSELFPGWKIKSGTKLVDFGMFDGISLGYPAMLGDARLIAVSGQTGLPVLGRHALDVTPVLGQEMTISQAGIVPADARSLRFIATSDSSTVFLAPSDFYKVSIDGIPVSLQWIRSAAQGLPIWEVAGDVSAFEENKCWPNHPPPAQVEMCQPAVRAAAVLCAKF
jgi:hypothetical protein